MIASVPVFLCCVLLIAFAAYRWCLLPIGRSTSSLHHPTQMPNYSMRQIIVGTLWILQCLFHSAKLFDKRQKAIEATKPDLGHLNSVARSPIVVVRRFEADNLYCRLHIEPIEVLVWDHKSEVQFRDIRSCVSGTRQHLPSDTVLCIPKNVNHRVDTIIDSTILVEVQHSCI